jgi:hypothetical protein
MLRHLNIFRLPQASNPNIMEILSLHLAFVFMASCLDTGCKFPSLQLTADVYRFVIAAVLNLQDPSDDRNVYQIWMIFCVI